MRHPVDIPEKHCATCGRPFQWRRKWAASWEEVRYCSRACRRSLSAEDKRLETIILDLIAATKQGSSICPSEAARLVAPDEWRAWMERTRQAARRLALRGLIEVTQKGRPVTHLNFKGPVRLRKAR